MRDLTEWGFTTVAEGVANDPLLHLYPWKNEFSPFSRADRLGLDPNATDKIIIDTCYGLVYDPWENVPEALYGKTEDLPKYAGDSLANMGYLRVPFRRIPRRLVKDRSEIENIVNKIVSADDDLVLLFRGQTREHVINRSSEAMHSLYGDPNAIEPSLLSSSARRGTTLENYFPEWCALLQLYLEYQIGNCSRWASTTTLEEMNSNRIKLTMSPNLAFFALAMAQHYGLPSFGLDMTSKIDVALFFALNKFERHPSDKHVYLFSRDYSRSEPSVIYLISSFKFGQLEYEKLRPKGFAASRPDCQSSHFFHTGWGFRKNNCALRVFLALYLDPSGDFGKLPTANELFPNVDNDPFGKFLEETVNHVKSPQIQELLQDFGWIVQK